MVQKFIEDGKYAHFAVLNLVILISTIVVTMAACCWTWSLQLSVSFCGQISYNYIWVSQYLCYKRKEGQNMNHWQEPH